MVAPHMRNSAASLHVVIPPIDESGRPTPLANCTAILRDIGLTLGPEKPPNVEIPLTEGFGTIVSRSIPVMDSTVFIADRASAPFLFAAFPIDIISVTFGVSLTITGTSATSLTHFVTSPANLGSCPIAEPMPPSAI